MPRRAPKSCRGSCLCGRVVFRVRFPSRFCSHCYCSNCRKAHGAGVVTYLGVAAERLSVLSGARSLSTYDYAYAFRGGRAVSSRQFCRHCGSTLFFRSSRWPGEVHVAAGSLDGPPDRSPRLHFYFDQKPSWLKTCDRLPRFGGPTGSRRLR